MAVAYHERTDFHRHGGRQFAQDVSILLAATPTIRTVCLSIISTERTSESKNAPALSTTKTIIPCLGAVPVVEMRDMQKVVRLVTAHENTLLAAKYQRCFLFPHIK